MIQNNLRTPQLAGFACQMGLPVIGLGVVIKAGTGNKEMGNEETGSEETGK